MADIFTIIIAGGRLQLFYKLLVVRWVFERAWKCAAMWDSKNAPFPFSTGRKVRWGKNLNFLCWG
jgi:hypothetical protein